MDLKQRSPKLQLCLVDLRENKEAFIKHFSRGKPKMTDHLNKRTSEDHFFLRNKTDDFIILSKEITAASQMDYIWLTNFY